MGFNPIKALGEDNMSNRISAIGDGDFEPNTQSAELVEAIQTIYQKQRPSNNETPKQVDEDHHMIGDTVINEQIDALNQKLLSQGKHAEFSVHKETNQTIVKIINDETGEVLKEWPKEKLLDMAAEIWKRFGIMVDKKV